MELVKRKITVKTYHATKGDALITALVVARSDRTADDPFFKDAAAKLARGKGKVVEYKVFIP